MLAVNGPLRWGSPLAPSAGRFSPASSLLGSHLWSESPPGGQLGGPGEGPWQGFAGPCPSTQCTECLGQRGSRTHCGSADAILLLRRGFGLGNSNNLRKVILITAGGSVVSEAPYVNPPPQFSRLSSEPGTLVALTLQTRTSGTECLCQLLSRV